MPTLITYRLQCDLPYQAQADKLAELVERLTRHLDPPPDVLVIPVETDVEEPDPRQTSLLVL